MRPNSSDNTNAGEYDYSDSKHSDFDDEGQYEWRILFTEPRDRSDRTLSSARDSFKMSTSSPSTEGHPKFQTGSTGQKKNRLLNNLFLKNLFASMGYDINLIPKQYPLNFLIVYNDLINYDPKADPDGTQAKQLYKSLLVCCEFYKEYLKKDKTPEQLIYDILQANQGAFRRHDWKGYFFAIAFSLSAALVNASGNEFLAALLIVNSLVYNVPLNITFSATKIISNNKLIWQYIKDKKTPWPAKIKVSLLSLYLTAGSLAYALGGGALASKNAATYSLKLTISVFSSCSFFTQRDVGLKNKLLSILYKKYDVQLWKEEPKDSGFTVKKVENSTVFIYLVKDIDQQSKWGYKFVNPAEAGSQMIHQGADYIEEGEIKSALGISYFLSEAESFNKIYPIPPTIALKLLEIPNIKKIIEKENSLWQFLKNSLTIHNVLHLGAVTAILLLYTQSSLEGIELSTGDQFWSTGAGDEQKAGPWDDTIFIIGAGVILPAVVYIPLGFLGIWKSIKNSYETGVEFLTFSESLATRTAHPTIPEQRIGINMPLLPPETKTSSFKEKVLAALGTVIISLGSIGTSIGLVINGLGQLRGKFSGLPGGNILAWVGALGIGGEVSGINLNPILKMLITKGEEKINGMEQSRKFFNNIFTRAHQADSTPTPDGTPQPS